MNILTRREFLKLASAFTVGGAYRTVVAAFDSVAAVADRPPNILIFVFDAMSAQHLSLYGYQRQTSPYLEALARRSFVYHAHFSAGNFTTSGVASLLTGAYPWNHRAINYRGMVRREVATENLFKVLGEGYTKAAFTQNMFAEILLSQFGQNLDIHLPPDSFSSYVIPFLQSQDFKRDRTMAYYAVDDFLGVGVRTLNPVPGSLPLAVADILRNNLNNAPSESISHPFGYPSNHSIYYENEKVFQGIAAHIAQLNSHSQPWLGYYHVWSPHGPYTPTRAFVGKFEDEISLPFRPRHKLAESRYQPRQLQEFRLRYDEYIANVDYEFGKFLLELEQANVLENTYVIVTSDHGELFERGELGHGTPLLYKGVTHVPLLISAPGQTERYDIHAPTSSLDLLPTILYLARRSIPNWLEGIALPGISPAPETTRPIFSFVAKDNTAFDDINRASVSMIRWPYEMIYYTGYPRFDDAFELYNVVDDPYEKKDLFKEASSIAAQMKDELLDIFHATIKPTPSNSREDR